MDTAYHEWEKRRQNKATARRSPVKRRHTSKIALGVRERRRLIQLGVCAALFTVVFIGKGVFPERIVQIRDNVLQVIQADTDFVAAFSSLGRSISEGKPVLNTLGDLWVDVFGSQQVSIEVEDLDRAPLYRAEQAFLSDPSIQAYEGISHLLRIEPASEEPPDDLQAQYYISQAEAQPIPSKVPEPTPEAEPSVQYVEYNGPALPENASMDKYSLGLQQIATPVMGWVSSNYGWREHPVDGEEKFHNGVDLAVVNGTAVGAFADGVIDYIGESPIYGQYLQIRHEGGVTSFYAHCSKLCVQQGQSVKAGDKVAESGATGNATGPHLHFELKLNGTLLNPLYYIENE